MPDHYTSDFLDSMLSLHIFALLYKYVIIDLMPYLLVFYSTYIYLTITFPIANPYLHEPCISSLNVRFHVYRSEHSMHKPVICLFDIFFLLLPTYLNICHHCHHHYHLTPGFHACLGWMILTRADKSEHCIRFHWLVLAGFPHLDGLPNSILSAFYVSPILKGSSICARRQKIKK